MSAPDAKRPPRPRRADYRHFREMPTRWMDNDVFGHVNNVVYYSYFDTVVNAFTTEAGVFDIATSPVVAYVVESGCRYHAPVSFPTTLSAGLRVGRLGGSSVRYEIALFAPDVAEAVADGHFVHVYVDRASGRPVPIPEPVRAVLAPLLARDAASAG